jgi:hypothetical protein
LRFDKLAMMAWSRTDALEEDGNPFFWRVPDDS